MKNISLEEQKKLLVELLDYITKVCMENNIDKVTANKLALCIEEIGTNIIDHGFKDKSLIRLTLE